MTRFSVSPLFILCLLFISTGCATKYVLPGNRFISPESVGGNFKVQAELQQTSAKLASIDVTGGSTNNKLIYSDKHRMGYFFGTSLMEQVDFIWYQTGGSVSFLGGRFQIMGGSKASKATGHKIAVTAALGGNEHEIDSGDPKIEFKMAGQDFSVIHGYRFSENFLLYDSLSFTKINFDGDLKSNNPQFNGLEVNYNTKLIGLFLGTELSYGPVMAKLEAGYQLIQSNHTPDREGYRFGYSVGYNF